MIVGIIALLFSGWTFGVIDVLLKKIQQEGNICPITMIRSSITLLGILLLLFIVPDSYLHSVYWLHHPADVAYNQVPAAIVLCFYYAFGLLFFMKALKYKKATETVGLNKIGVLLGVLISVFVYI